MASESTAIAMTIAGSDPSGGAGLQADLKTFSALGVYGCAVVTALTAQNTRGVTAVWPVPVGSVAQQIATVLEDVPVRAIKLGMLLNSQVIAEVASELAKYPQVPVICDPVMVATSGDRLLKDDAINALTQRLIPHSTLITPNTREAAVLLDCPPAESQSAMGDQAEQLLELGSRAVLLKGGHLSAADAPDLLVWRENGRIRRELLNAPRVDTRNTHGTGCTLAAAVAAAIARGDSLLEAVRRGKEFISQAIAHADRLRVGSGAGPVNHLFGYESSSR